MVKSASAGPVRRGFSAMEVILFQLVESKGWEEAEFGHAPQFGKQKRLCEVADMSADSDNASDEQKLANKESVTRDGGQLAQL